MNRRTHREERLHEFVGHLIDLGRRASDGDPTARAALARLRRGLGQPPGGAPETFQDVLPHLPDSGPYYYERDRADYFLIGSLFALHPKHDTEHRTLGGTLGALGTENDSAVKRFTNLLAARKDQLPDLLRQAVSIAAQEGVTINYYQLAQDLARWDNEQRSVQLGWAREYWPPQS